jgi:hypothetical protein
MMSATVGCTPRLSPLYRDFSLGGSGTGSAATQDRIVSALEKAGWTVIEGVTANVVATQPRKFRSWGIYSMEVELEVARVGNGHVRVFIHPYRHYFTGSRGKQPYLRSGLAKSVMKTLQDPFAAEGLTFVGTAQSRDKAHRESEGS